MLMQKGLDAIRINVDFDKSLWNMLTQQLIDMAALQGLKWWSVKGAEKKINGLATEIYIAGVRLQISVLQCMKSRWISYEFKGKISVSLFDAATVLFGEYSFANALCSKRTKRLELAVDYFGLHSTDYISHYHGIKTSRVISNALENGFTQYSGSKCGRTQLAVYDKAQEIVDKGGVPIFKTILRIELRLLNRKQSLPQLVERLLHNDPFNKVSLVRVDAAMKHETNIAAWPMFLSAAREFGVAKALKLFPEHKKSFLKFLKVPSIQTRIPSMADFGDALIDLLEQVASVNLQCGYGYAYAENEVHQPVASNQFP
jgi:hypothetical protein